MFEAMRYWKENQARRDAKIVLVGLVAFAMDLGGLAISLSAIASSDWLSFLIGLAIMAASIPLMCWSENWIS